MFSVVISLSQRQEVNRSALLSGMAGIAAQALDSLPYPSPLALLETL
jgi:hypothetical protein